MDPEAIRSALATLGWSARMLAKRVPCNVRRAQRWVSGAEPMPEAVAEWLARLAELAERAPAPGAVKVTNMINEPWFMEAYAQIDRLAITLKERGIESGAEVGASHGVLKVL
jgi:hypothetical protein